MHSDIAGDDGGIITYANGTTHYNKQSVDSNLNSALGGVRIVSKPTVGYAFNDEYSINSIAIIFVSSGYVHNEGQRSCDIYFITCRANGGSIPQITKIANNDQSRNIISVTATENGKFTISQAGGTGRASTYQGYIL